MVISLDFGVDPMSIEVLSTDVNINKVNLPYGICFPFANPAQ